MTLKKDAVGNNPLSHLIPRGPALRPAAPALPQVPAAAPPPAPVATAAPAPVPTTVSAPPPPAAVIAESIASAAPVAAPASSAVAAAAQTPSPASADATDDDLDPSASAPGATPLKRCTVRLPVALLERMTSAIVHTPGMTQADFVADAVLAHLAVLEKDRGSAFPVYGKRLRPGRKSW